jgi:hypothetical protein
MCNKSLESSDFSVNEVILHLEEQQSDIVRIIDSFFLLKIQGFKLTLNRKKQCFYIKRRNPFWYYGVVTIMTNDRKVVLEIRIVPRTFTDKFLLVLIRGEIKGLGLF